MVISSNKKLIKNNKIQCILSLNVSRPWATIIGQEEILIYDKILCEAILDNNITKFDDRLMHIQKHVILINMTYLFKNFQPISVGDLYVGEIEKNQDFIFFNNGMKEIVLYKRDTIWNRFI